MVNVAQDVAAAAAATLDYAATKWEYSGALILYFAARVRNARRRRVRLLSLQVETHHYYAGRDRRRRWARCRQRHIAARYRRAYRRCSAAIFHAACRLDTVGIGSHNTDIIQAP